TTKLHALTDVVGRPFALTLTAGNAADITVAPALLARAERVKYLIADKGYDGDGLRSTIRQAGAVPVIPGRANRKRKVRLDARRYRDRHLVENAFCRLKDFRRVATRYDKLAANFLSAAALAAIVAFWI
ncbi:IS5 family transposase, partial [Chelativorans sp. J32]